MPKAPLGYVTLTLHAHLPYVVNHGTWPHGMEWLLEAAAETYLPLLRVIGELQRDGIALNANINLTPILMEQLAHPTFKAEFPRYLRRKIEAAVQDEAQFLGRGETHIASLAGYWKRWYSATLNDFDMWNGDILGAFRRFQEAEVIEVFTCAATHGYFPLLGTDEAIRAQIRTGVQTYERHMGCRPRGIWLPECGYRPRGLWSRPSLDDPTQPFQRQGVEELVGEFDLDYFFVDTHLLERSAHFFPYDHMFGNALHAFEMDDSDPRESYYQPFYAGQPRRGVKPVAFFPRDPRTSVQVWSGEQGYPGDAAYLEFHKKHYPGGHRYWRVTSPKSDLALKQPYYPEIAASHTGGHAQHFAKIAWETIQKHPASGGVLPVLNAPFDAELFGHWWFEGPQFLKHVAQELAKPESPLRLTTCSKYLAGNAPQGYVKLEEGSWGKNGTNEVWYNADTAWTWTHIYPAEERVRQISREGRWRENEQAKLLMKQICREMLLLESSDWQFLITMGQARDYAEKRFVTHMQQLTLLLDMWKQYETQGWLDSPAMMKLAAIEARDPVFPDIDPAAWS